jgi:ABC-type phosphate transport system auxiliary subunit
MVELKEKQLQVQTSMTAEKAAQYAAHVERLEQRVRVLERIITDKGVALSDEIEQLRDSPVN